MTDDATDSTRWKSLVEWWLSQGEWASDRPVLAALFLVSQLALLVGVCWVVLR